MILCKRKMHMRFECSAEYALYASSVFVASLSILQEPVFTSVIYKQRPQSAGRDVGRLQEIPGYRSPL